MSNFLKKAIELLSMTEKKKQREKKNDTGSIPETGQSQVTGDAETGKRKEEEETEMKLKDKGKLFVGGLSYATSTEGLKAYFSRFGSVVDAVVMTFPDTGRSRGYGFVTFADPASAKVALTVESHVIDGKAVDIRLFESNRKKSKFQKRKESRLFLEGIPCDMKQEDLKNFFSRYGKVSNIIIPHSKVTDKPKGYAFLSFEEKEAAEKCLSESFVHLGNKRVVIKKATARDGLTETVSDLKDGVECCGSHLKSAAGYGDDVSSLPDDDCQSSASGDRTSLFEQFPGFLSIFENYFQPMIANGKLANKMERREEDQKWQPSVRDTQENEKLLASFLREASKAGGYTFLDEDVTDDDDDDDSEESVSDEEEDGTDYGVDEEDGDDDDHDNPVFERGSAVDELSAKLKEILMAKTTEAKIGNLKSSVYENELLAFQSSSLPFIIKDKAGSLRCSLCQWTPPDGSCETFLAHCNTSGHKMKTKGRFMSKDIQVDKAKNRTSNPSREIDSRMISFETGLNRIWQGLSEEQNKIQTGQDSRKQGKKKLPQPDEQISQQQQQQQQQEQKKKQQQYNQQMPQQPQPQQKKKKKTQQQPGQQTPQQVQQQPGKQTTQKSQQELQKGNQNSENPSQSANIKNTKKIPNLKVQALAKGMVCIQPLSPNELSCRMCNKVIPKASDFVNLMKNVSSHLQSKGHLSKLHATEGSLEKALNKNPEQGQKNMNGKNTTTEKKEQAPTRKGKNPRPGNNSEKTDKKIGKMAPAANVATPKVNFLCLVCNYFANKQETFNAHINSKVHSDTFKRTNSNLNNCSAVFCKDCRRSLFGSLYDISKHISKCSK